MSDVEAGYSQHSTLHKSYEVETTNRSIDSDRTSNANNSLFKTDELESIFIEGGGTVNVVEEEKGKNEKEVLENGKHLRYCSTLNRWISNEEEEEGEGGGEEDENDANINFVVSSPFSILWLCSCVCAYTCPHLGAVQCVLTCACVASFFSTLQAAFSRGVCE